MIIHPFSGIVHNYETKKWGYSAYKGRSPKYIIKIKKQYL